MPRLWCLAIVAAVIVGMTSPTDAHKPITSPFTFSADVQPILRDRCGRCHAPGGVAPMSLLTHVDTVPWGESIRMELLSGHMPPWRVDRGAARFHDGDGLTAKELNVLLTWLTGGTPPGDPPPGDQAITTPRWTLGTPDIVRRLPRVTLGADEQERTAEFVVPMVGSDQMVRAIDLLPGTPAIVRSAVIEVQATGRPATRDERLLSLWVPGDQTTPLVGAGLALPRDAKLVVRVRYRKTWDYERREMTDESQIGIYAAPVSARPLQRVSLSPATPVTLSQASQAIALYPDATMSDVAVVVTATRPDGRRDELIAFHPQRGWARRYWFREPVSLPRGTRLSVRITPESPALLPPGYIKPAASSVPSSRVFVNVM